MQHLHKLIIDRILHNLHVSTEDGLWVNVKVLYLILNASHAPGPSAKTFF